MTPNRSQGSNKGESWSEVPRKFLGTFGCFFVVFGFLMNPGLGRAFCLGNVTSYVAAHADKAMAILHSGGGNLEARNPFREFAN